MCFLIVFNDENYNGVVCLRKCKMQECTGLEKQSATAYMTERERENKRERDRERERACSPLHDNQQTLSALIKVLVDVDDSHDVGARRRPPVELHLPAGLGAVLQHLGGEKKTGGEVKRV